MAADKRGMVAIGRLAGGIGGAVLGYALPPRCAGCGAIVAGDHRFCLDCWSALDFLGDQACASCGTPFETAAAAGVVCEACRAVPPALDGMRAAVAYGEIARTLALKLKYGGRIGLAETMARAMARLLPPRDDTVLIVPVPLHRWRLWGRGFNQAALIAAALARLSGHPLDAHVLRRTRPTPVLRALGRRARARAVRDAFGVDRRRVDRLGGATVLLVDDVYTTGATAAACAATLKAAGAREVRLLCWARVQRPERDAANAGRAPG